MPEYGYVCQGCGKPFEVRASMAAYSKGLVVRCPHCQSRKVIRAFTPVGVLTGSKRQIGANLGSCSGPGCCGGK